jgi:hypothetical protein
MHTFLALMHVTSDVACMIFGGMYIEHQDVKKIALGTEEYAPVV